MKTTMSNQITLTLSDSQMKKLSKLERLATLPRIVDFEYFKLKLNSEGITKEQIISAMLDSSLQRMYKT